MKIELLTRGEDGHAVPGRVIDYDPMTVGYQAAERLAPQGTLTAVNCKFIWNGEPVRFFVPMDLLQEVREVDEDGYEYVTHQPTEEAEQLVTERMIARSGSRNGS